MNRSFSWGVFEDFRVIHYLPPVEEVNPCVFTYGTILHPQRTRKKFRVSDVPPSPRPRRCWLWDINDRSEDFGLVISMHRGSDASLPFRGRAAPHIAPKSTSTTPFFLLGASTVPPRAKLALFTEDMKCLQ